MRMGVYEETLRWSVENLGDNRDVNERRFQHVQVQKKWKTNLVVLKLSGFFFQEFSE